MDRTELASFLRSRRERLTPASLGLPAGARRRTPGLRREEVADLAHISTEYYVRLEQGRAPQPSGTVLGGIATALRLSESESEHLHLLAGTAAVTDRRHRRDVAPEVVEMLDHLPLTAGFVVSAAYEVLAWNDLAAALMEDFGSLDEVGRNLARRAFLGAGDVGPRAYAAADASRFRVVVACSLRSALARYPHDPDVVGLVADLRAGSAEFERLWARHDVEVPRTLTKTFTHRELGDITVDCQGFDLADRDQHLVPYTAAPGSDSARALERLAGTAGAPSQL